MVTRWRQTGSVPFIDPEGKAMAPRYARLFSASLAVRLLLYIWVCLVLPAGCSSDGDDAPVSPAYLARDYLRDTPYANLRVEVDYVAGYPPRQAALNLLRQRLIERCNKNQVTVLIDDAFLRLVGETADISWHDRKHFYRAAARVMRRMLIDHERQRRAERRGGGEHKRMALDPDMLGETQQRIDVLALDEALTRLSQIDPRQSEIVELHHFGGCSLKETAKLLGISLTTAKADWRTAKAWLHRELTRHRSSG